MIKKLVMCLCCLVLLCGCSAPKKESGYKKITSGEAKEKMDSLKNVIILDVRTKEEYDQGHISGALLLPNTDIAKKAADALPDKDVPILVYCRSGNRSKSASEDLISMGYTQVYDFGGIIDWPYETVTE